MSRPFLVVLAGGTASGKTTVAKRIVPILDCALITHDRYYRDVAEPRGHNYDAPEALDNDRLVADVKDLLAGRTAHLPVYEFSTHQRQANTEAAPPRPIIIVEGILTLAIPELAALADLRVFVKAPADVRLARRIARDVVERGRDVAGVLDQYLNTVRPMHIAHVQPCQAAAHLILNGETHPDSLVQVLREAIDRRRQNG